MRAAFWKIIVAAAMFILALPGHARITRVVIARTDVIGSGGYQKLTGHAYGEIDPKLPLNAIITDLEFAPRNARGMVEYVATLTIIKPADMTKASGVLLYFVPNRGRINLTGGGFLADARKRGHVLVASGWQGDLAPADGVETLVGAVGKKSGRVEHHRTGSRAFQRHARRMRRPCRSSAAASPAPPTPQVSILRKLS